MSLDPTDVVAAPVSSTPTEVAEALAAEHYGLQASARRLSSERDENFQLTTAGKEFLLKISNAAEDREVADFQTGALLHLERVDPELPVPRLQRSRDGHVAVLVRTAGDAPRVMRLQTFLPGLPLIGVERSAAQVSNLGAMLARLDIALGSYEHPGGTQPLRWDLCHARTLRPLVALIDDAARRALVTDVLDRFERLALPVLATLRRQVIHNDFQPSNVLVDARDPTRITGIIDFGDMVRAPLINDLAVAAAYQVSIAPGPLDFVSSLIGAYDRRLPVSDAETAILFDLIATRLVLTALITNWRVRLQPGNRDYILRHADAAWTGLRRFSALNPDAACAQLMRARRLE